MDFIALKEADFAPLAKKAEGLLTTTDAEEAGKLYHALRACAEGVPSPVTGFATVHVPTAFRALDVPGQPRGLLGDKCYRLALLEAAGLFQTTFAQTWGRVYTRDPAARVIERCGTLGIDPFAPPPKSA